MNKEQVNNAIIKHSCIGGAIALVPVPIVGEIAVVVNQLAMYRKLNELAGVKFSDNVLKNIGKFLLSQLAGVFGGMAAIIGVTAVARFIPGLNFLAGLAAAPIAAAANYVCGKAYAEMIGGFVAKGGTDNLSDEEIIAAIKAGLPSEERLKKFHTEGKCMMADVKFSDYRQNADDCVNEATNNPQKYQ